MPNSCQPASYGIRYYLAASFLHMLYASHLLEVPRRE